MTTALLAVNFKSVMQAVGGVAIGIAILLVMVTIHEFGHYIAGKILGFKINEFSVGFGPAIFKKRSKKSGELFALRIIPLGGYCAFDGEDDDGTEEPVKKENGEEPFEEMKAEVSPSEKEQTSLAEKSEITESSQDTLVQENKEEKKEEYPEPKGARFNDQAPWKRIIVLVAGATMNYLLALFLIIVMFVGFGGVRSYVSFATAEEGVSAPVGTETSFADGDIVLSVNGKDIYMPSDYVNILSGKKQGERVEVVVSRIVENGGEKTRVRETLTITLLSDCKCKNMNDMNAVYSSLGMNTDEKSGFRFGNAIVKESGIEGFFKSIGRAFVYSFKTAGMVLQFLGELITFKIGLSSTGGPITVVASTAQMVQKVDPTVLIPSILNMAGMIGVNLAVFNLLPVPALDGCKVIFCIIEWIRKKPINRKVETIIHFVGIIALFGFAILVDVLHFVLMSL